MAGADGRDRDGRTVQLNNRKQLSGKVIARTRGQTAIFAVDKVFERPVTREIFEPDPISDLKPIQRVTVIMPNHFSLGLFVIPFDVWNQIHKSL